MPPRAALDATALETLHPRLHAARVLMEEGAVRLDGELASVGTNEPRHIVRWTMTGHRCFCPRNGRHQDNRDPRKYVLAVELVERG
ncbi:hypothetical protein [Modestobacter sp. Leaf380]|uniref:hypothetical protein n=1 Tax=Modestobacter sp. Leaf380 TaxID=1736356 RepID=UPI0006FEFB20|nr:hypothetical protein [Modestobacter sp. Leaf380]